MTDIEQRKIFSNNLLRLLSRSEKTQKEVADAISVSPQTFNTWCQGIALPRMGKVQRLADYFNVSKSDLIDEQPIKKPRTYKCIKIPVFGTVAAGTPIDAIENILGYEDIPEEWAKYGDYFALVIKGDSMFPDIHDGDRVIVKNQSVVENGEIAIVCVNGETATCKRIQRYEKELCLISLNPSYETMRFTPEEVNSLPITIMGKVVEVRRKV